MTDELDFTALEKAVKLIGKHRRCHETLDFYYLNSEFERVYCGCDSIHGIFYQCDYHHKQMVELAETLWKDANNEGLIVEELFGIKMCRTNIK